MFDPLTSPVAYVLIVALLGVLALALAGVWPFFGRLSDVPAQGGARRIVTLDGLRGLLAVTVFFHHAMIFHTYYGRGEWELPASDGGFYAACGKVPVWTFFMITGFLFWSKVLVARAEGKRLGVRRLYVSRFRRLFPAYGFSLAFILVLTGVATGWTLREPPMELGRHVGQWLACGVFDFPYHNLLNSYDTTYINAGITWTLRYEWYFYLLLPLLALLAAPEAFMCFVIGFLVFYAVRRDPGGLAHLANFLLGMTAAYVVPASGKLKATVFSRRPTNSVLSAGMVVLALGAVLVLYREWHEVGSLGLRVLVFGAFVMIVRGNSLCGLLTCRPARILGAMSYSFYLLHGIVLSTALLALNHVWRVGSLSPVEYWAVMAGVASGAVSIHFCEVGGGGGQRSPVSMRRFSISSREWRGLSESHMPGQRSAEAVQDWTSLRFIFQKGQVRHWTGRTG